jgi:putative component of membrane protein insertase Oxa1/YidC/SpoIIIJ protein YidD
MPSWLKCHFSIITIFLISTVYANCQTIALKSDFELIKNSNFENPNFTAPTRNVKFMLTKNRNVFVRYNPISLFFGGIMYGYQKIISQQLATNCPYEHSCSNFAIGCIKTHGLVKGLALSADRLTRCNEIALKDLKLFELTPAFKIIDSPSEY